MKKFCELALGCCLLYSAIQLGKCIDWKRDMCKPGYFMNEDGKCVEKTPHHNCGVFEVYSDCASPCNTCENIGHPCNFFACNAGCDCMKGYRRDERGICIPESLCPPSQKECGFHASYSDCASLCPPTCAKKDMACAAVCVKGCVCDPGYILDEFGICIPEDQCPPNPNHPECGKNEKYVECVPCGNTCETYEQRLYCKQACRPGCTCNDGLVKNKNGKCVPPEKCDTPPTQCGLNEEYNGCGTACPETCDNRGIAQACTEQCVAGCFCKPGFVRDRTNTCVQPEMCNQRECGENEEYSGCGSSCPDTCENYGRTRICTMQCVSGCFCKKGLVRDEKRGNKCIIPEKCGKKQCNKDEVYMPCGTACPKTCDNYDQQNVGCTKNCVAGCFCKEGEVRDTTDLTCVKPEQCPNYGCNKPFEEYSYCVNPCNNCELKGNCQFLVCNKGCNCIAGHYRDGNGNCIPEKKCPPIQCGKNEYFSECATPCPPTCSERNPECPNQGCARGCYCKSGFIREEVNGPCIEVALCPKNPPHHCPKDEEHYECIPDCTNTCESYGKNVICPAICKPGCFCKKGLVKRKDGRCVDLSQCDSPTAPNCPKDEKYYENKPECPNTCEVWPIRSSVFCAPGPPGCFCIEGLVLRKDGKCVPPEQCDPTCGKNEKIVPCAKPKWCNTCGIRGDCKLTGCSEGCDCKPGYYRDGDGVCIPESQCPHDGSCRKNEVFVTCGCPATCDNKTPDCTTQCNKGCFCKEGYILDKVGGDCIPIEQCPRKCRINEEFSMCGTCPATCDNRKPICTMECKVGCFCKKGYVLNVEGGICIPEDICPREHCGPNAYYSDCASLCPPTCNQSQKPRACPAVCIKGCICNPGFILNDQGICIPEHQCRPNTNLCKRHGEVFKSCGSPCEATCMNIKFRIGIKCPKPCEPGCFCRDGLVRDSYGNCVHPRQCGRRRCGRHASYSQCASLCPPTCRHRNRTCAEVCFSGCTCNPGYILDDRGISCIPEFLCPPNTDPGCKCDGPPGGDFCPPKSDIVCVRAANQCCGNHDCPLGQLCCQEGCGNKCYAPVRDKTNGENVVYDRNCVRD